MSSVTKQGVRDLNSIGPRRVKAQKMVLPQFLCPHAPRDLYTDDDTNETVCRACDTRWNPRTER